MTKITTPNSKKQSLYDFYEKNIKEIMQNATRAFLGNGKLTITYPSGFKYELLETDFPNRNLVEIYGRNRKGKMVIIGYERDKDPLPPLARAEEMDKPPEVEPVLVTRVKAALGVKA